jgi:hypothetical protein
LTSFPCCKRTQARCLGPTESMPDYLFADRVAASAAHLPTTSLLKESDMHNRLQSIVFCMGIATLPQVAMAAGASVEKSPVAQEHTEQGARPGKQRNNTEKKAVRLQGAQPLNSGEQDLATISAQADAAEAACASQPGDAQEACRKQVSADRERATAAIRKKQEQGVRRN